MARQPNIDWSYWLQMPEIKAWEAVALSLNLDPEQMVHLKEGWMAGAGSDPLFEDESFPDKQTKNEFYKRLRLLLAALKDRQVFSAGRLSLANPGDNGVRLQEVATWLVCIGRQPLSQELVKAAAAERESPVPHTNATKADSSEPDTAAETWKRAANKWGRREHAEHPKWSVEQIAQRVASRLESAGIRGRGNRIIKWETIKRHALVGVKNP